MVGSIGQSEINRQLYVLSSVLEDQRQLCCLELDLRCVEAMKKLVKLVEETESLEGVLLRKIQRVLVDNKESFNQGIERLRFECFASRFFYVFSLDPPSIGEVARDQLLAKEISFEQKIEEWVSASSQGELRLEASSRILRCLKGDGFLSLNLNGLSLRTLPDIFGSEILVTKLGSLSLSRNQLIELPESICKLKALKKLEINENPLIALPENIGSLFGLEELYVSFTYITTFPESIGNLRSLSVLHAGYNLITTFPDSIGNLDRLENLIAQGTLTLTDISNGILRLPSTCLVNFKGCKLSLSVLSDLQAVMTAPEYNGPTIQYSSFE